MGGGGGADMGACCMHSAEHVLPAWRLVQLTHKADTMQINDTQPNRINIQSNAAIAYYRKLTFRL